MRLSKMENARKERLEEGPRCPVRFLLAGELGMEGRVETPQRYAAARALDTNVPECGLKDRIQSEEGMRAGAGLILVCDELHAVMGEGYDARRMLQRGELRESMLVGFTATPDLEKMMPAVMGERGRGTETEGTERWGRFLLSVDPSRTAIYPATMLGGEVARGWSAADSLSLVFLSLPLPYSVATAEAIQDGKTCDPASPSTGARREEAAACELLRKRVNSLGGKDVTADAALKFEWVKREAVTQSEKNGKKVAVLVGRSAGMHGLHAYLGKDASLKDAMEGTYVQRGGKPSDVEEKRKAFNDAKDKKLIVGDAKELGLGGDLLADLLLIVNPDSSLDKILQAQARNRRACQLLGDGREGVEAKVLVGELQGVSSVDVESLKAAMGEWDKELGVRKQLAGGIAHEAMSRVLDVAPNEDMKVHVQRVKWDAKGSKFATFTNESVSSAKGVVDLVSGERWKRGGRVAAGEGSKRWRKGAAGKRFREFVSEKSDDDFKAWAEREFKEGEEVERIVSEKRHELRETVAAAKRATGKLKRSQFLNNEERDKTIDAAGEISRLGGKAQVRELEEACKEGREDCATGWDAAVDRAMLLGAELSELEKKVEEAEQRRKEAAEAKRRQKEKEAEERAKAKAAAEVERAMQRGDEAKRRREEQAKRKEEAHAAAVQRREEKGKADLERAKLMQEIRRSGHSSLLEHRRQSAIEAAEFARKRAEREAGHRMRLSTAKEESSRSLSAERARAKAEMRATATESKADATRAKAEAKAFAAAQAERAKKHAREERATTAAMRKEQKEHMQKEQQKEKRPRMVSVVVATRREAHERLKRKEAGMEEGDGRVLVHLPESGPGIELSAWSKGRGGVKSVRPASSSEGSEGSISYHRSVGAVRGAKVAALRVEGEGRSQDEIVTAVQSALFLQDDAAGTGYVLVLATKPRIDVAALSSGGTTLLRSCDVVGKGSRGGYGIAIYSSLPSLYWDSSQRCERVGEGRNSFRALYRVPPPSRVPPPPLPRAPRAPSPHRGKEISQTGDLRLEYSNGTSARVVRIASPILRLDEEANSGLVRGTLRRFPRLSIQNDDFDRLKAAIHEGAFGTAPPLGHDYVRGADRTVVYKIPADLNRLDSFHPIWNTPLFVGNYPLVDDQTHLDHGQFTKVRVDVQSIRGPVGVHALLRDTRRESLSYAALSTGNFAKDFNRLTVAEEEVLKKVCFGLRTASKQKFNPIIANANHHCIAFLPGAKLGSSGSTLEEMVAFLRRNTPEQKKFLSVLSSYHMYDVNEWMHAFVNAFDRGV